MRYPDLEAYLADPANHHPVCSCPGCRDKRAVRIGDDESVPGYSLGGVKSSGLRMSQDAPESLLATDGKPISEAAFMRLVEKLARQCGFLVYHTHDSRRSEPGFPDLVLAKPPLVWFLETKTDKGKPTPDQLTWIATLSRCTTVLASVERPRDLGEIIRLLSTCSG